jgi:hypothetical protein
MVLMEFEDLSNGSYGLLAVSFLEDVRRLRLDCQFKLTMGKRPPSSIRDFCS